MTHPDTKPEALRLADVVETLCVENTRQPAKAGSLAASAIRRLHAECESLRTKLQTQALWYDDKRAAAEGVRKALAHRLHPNVNLHSSSLGVGNEAFKAGAAVDIHDTIRHRLAWDKAQAECLTHHDGSLNWKTMLGVQYDEPMHYGADPLPTIEQEPDHA